MEIFVFLFFSIFKLVYSVNKVELIFHQNSKYLQIEVGEPAQPLLFHLDFSSSVNIIFNSKCPGCDPKYQRYNPVLSSTLKKSHINYSINTINGEFNGVLSNEKFEFTPNLIYNLDFILINQRTTSYLECDGVLGLGYINSNSSEFKSMSLIANLKNSGKIDSEIVTVYLTKGIINIGNDMNKDWESRSSNEKKTILKFSPTDTDYPSFTSHIRGFIYWEGNTKNYESQKISKDIHGELGFDLFSNNKLNKLIIPSSQKDNIWEYYNKMLFPQKESLKNSEAIPKLQFATDEETEKQIWFYDNSTWQHTIFETGIMIDEYVLMWETASSKSTNNKFVFNIDINDEIEEEIFVLNWDYLGSNVIVFNYVDNEILLYQCKECGLKVIERKFTWLYLTISISSLSTILLMWLSICHFIKIKRGKATQFKVLKSYNLWI